MAQNRLAVSGTMTSKTGMPTNPKLHIPPALTFSNDVSHIVKILRNQGVVTIGRIGPNHLIWPISRAQALDLLHYFVEHLLVSFGTYQDAMTGSDPYLFHSRLSFALNSKLLHPFGGDRVCG
jgi:deoxyribodipyrimidine photolyase-related protein